MAAGNELLEAVRNSFTNRLESDTMAKSLLKKIRSGSATFEEAERYAERIGQLLAKAFGEQLTAEQVGGNLTEELARLLLEPMLKQNHQLVTNAAAEVMESLNQAAGLQMKAVRPAIETDRVEGLIQKAASYENFEEAAWLFQDPVVNFSQHTADRLIEENVNSHFKAGLAPKITRKVVGGCCKWCSDLAGEYDYPVKREVYRRHENCRCLVLYNPGDGKIQNAHTKKIYDSVREAEREAQIQRRKEKLEKWEKERTLYPEVRKEIIRRVKSGEYSLKLKHQKYLQHTKGTPQYELATKERGKAQSYLTISEKEAQELIQRYTGLGEPHIIGEGKIGNSEFYSTGRLIGYYHEDGIPKPTDRIQIVHGKSGSHIVPVKPLEIEL